jgi:hypothetical protein
VATGDHALRKRVAIQVQPVNKLRWTRCSMNIDKSAARKQSAQTLSTDDNRPMYVSSLDLPGRAVPTGLSASSSELSINSALAHAR